MKTSVTKANDITRVWHVVDVSGQTLGRVSTKIATLLMGKNKPYFTGNLDCGDYVVVVNAKDIAVTGQKKSKKIYRHHTGYPGGFREYTLKQKMDQDPRKVVEHSIKGMLPKNKLRSQRMKRLKIFVDGTHPYENQLQDTSKQ